MQNRNRESRYLLLGSVIGIVVALLISVPLGAMAWVNDNPRISEVVEILSRTMSEAEATQTAYIGATMNLLWSIGAYALPAICSGLILGLLGGSFWYRKKITPVNLEKGLETDAKMAVDQTATPQRGGCLSFFLIAILIINPLTSLYYLFYGEALREFTPSMPAWAIPILIILGIANFIFAIGIWKWKKWGIYGFAATSFIAFIINFIGLGLFAALFGLIGLGLVIFLLRNLWNQME